jgi:protease-4
MSTLPPASTDPNGPSPAPADAVSVAPGEAALLAQATQAFLLDRKRERRWRIFFRLAWLLVAVSVIVLVSSQRVASSAPNGPHTALIDVRGEIAADAEASAENLMPALRSAFEDAGSRAVVLRINSPGGSPVQAGLINDEVRRLKALHNKKVYAVCEELCASAAFYIAVAADEVYADKASIVGSIGVLMDGFGFTGLMEKLGIERRLITAGENKGLLDPFSPQSPQQVAHAQAMIDQIHQQFIQVVKEGRGERLKDVPGIFSGLFWNGQQAVELGLVDAVGSLDHVAREVVQAEEVIDYTPRENVAERLVRRFGAAIGEGAVRAMRSFSPLR